MLAPLKRRLTGVDLSSAMVARARERGIYDELAVAELCEFMHQRRAEFDAIVSADTLVYFGDLAPPLHAAYATRCDRAASWYSRSKCSTTRAVVRGTGWSRMGDTAYSRHYVADALAGAGLRVRLLEDAILRRERGADVIGMVVVADLA